MTTKENTFPGNPLDERRVDGPNEAIDDGVLLAEVDGVGPAVDYMERAGVERDTALRVLTAPQFHRETKQGALARVIAFLTVRLRHQRR